VLATHNVPAAIGDQITGSLGGALSVAESLGGATGAMLANLGRAAFMDGTQASLAVGAGTAFAGALLTLWLLPSGLTRQQPDAGADGSDPEE